MTPPVKPKWRRNREHLAATEHSRYRHHHHVQVIFAPSWLTVRWCRRCRANNSSNATLAGKAWPFTPVDKQGGLKEAELKAPGFWPSIRPQASRLNRWTWAIIITGESAKTATPVRRSVSFAVALGDFVSPAPGRIWNQSLPVTAPERKACLEQRMRRVLNTISAAASLQLRASLTRKSQRHRLP